MKTYLLGIFIAATLGSSSDRRNRSGPKDEPLNNIDTPKGGRTELHDEFIETIAPIKKLEAERSED